MASLGLAQINELVHACKFHQKNFQHLTSTLAICSADHKITFSVVKTSNWFKRLGCRNQILLNGDICPSLCHDFLSFSIEKNAKNNIVPASPECQPANWLHARLDPHENSLLNWALDLDLDAASFVMIHPADYSTMLTFHPL